MATINEALEIINRGADEILLQEELKKKLEATGAKVEIK